MRSQSITSHERFDETEDSECQARILLVEDNPGDAELIRVVLERNVTKAVEVAQSCRLSDAIARIETESFESIILDLGLPDSKGLETLERMLRASRSVPVIVLTGREDPDLIQTAIRLGAQDCLCKNHVSGELLVRTISSSIERQKVLTAAIDLSLIDELTGLHNRRGLTLLSSTFLSASKAASAPVTMVCLDLDGLKRINDTHGHQTGDQALIETARILRSSFSKGDLVCRLGGDEFAVVVVGNSLSNAAGIRRRVEERLAAANQLPDRVYELALSIGTAEYDPERHRDLNDLLHEADQAMYDEKKRRR